MEAESTEGRERVPMSCRDAMIKKVATVRQSDTVETALKLLKKENTGIVPVLDDEQGRVVGIFSTRTLLREILPVSVSVPAQGENTSLDITIPATLLGAAPGLSTRLQRLKPEAVSTVTAGRFLYVTADTPLWVGINRLTDAGEAVPVLDADGMLEGVISEQSLFEALEKVA
jgi:CBS-domain-containing membrane protein